MWQDFEKILKEFPLLLFKRPQYRLKFDIYARDHNLGSYERHSIEDVKVSNGYYFLDNPKWDLSSSFIRECLSRGDECAYSEEFQPVLEYIKAHNLYGFEGS